MMHHSSTFFGKYINTNVNVQTQEVRRSLSLSSTTIHWFPLFFIGCCFYSYVKEVS
jgi:hypothetical protein